MTKTIFLTSYSERQGGYWPQARQNCSTLTAASLFRNCMNGYRCSGAPAFVTSFSSSLRHCNKQLFQQTIGQCSIAQGNTLHTHPKYLLYNRTNYNLYLCVILVWTYTIPLYKEANCLKSKMRQYQVNHEIWNFFKLSEPTLKHPRKHPWLPDHRPPLTPPLSCSLTLLLFFPLFFNILKLKSSKISFVVHSMPIKATMKADSFSWDNCNKQLS